jgi:hypothetical protein
MEGKMGRKCSTNGEKKSAKRPLVGESEGKRPPGGSRCKWVDSMKMDLGEI